MLQYDFDESVGYWITMTSHAIRRALTEELAGEGITIRQCEVLAWLALEGEQSQVELAERLGIEAPTLAGVLSRMERDGWLTRRSCSEDRRRKLLSTTEKAEAVWERMVACCRRVRAQATRGISPENLELLKSLCEQIRRNVGQHQGGGAREKPSCSSVFLRDPSTQPAKSTP